MFHQSYSARIVYEHAVKHTQQTITTQYTFNSSKANPSSSSYDYINYNSSINRYDEDDDELEVICNRNMPCELFVRPSNPIVVKYLE